VNQELLKEAGDALLSSSVSHFGRIIAGVGEASGAAVMD